MKFSHRIAAAAAIAATLAGFASAAQATPKETLTWSGTTQYGTDGGPAQFGGANFSSLAGKAFTIALSYDPTALTSDSCGVNSNTYCNWNFGTVTETITINAITHTYSASGGSLGLGVTPNAINLSASGPSQFNLSVQDTVLMFLTNPTNANRTTYSFTNVPVTGTWGSSNLGGSASIGGNLTSLSAVYDPGVTHVPEPASLALFGTGLVGAGAMVRRRKRKTA